MPKAKRKTLTGRGAVGKTAVAGIKDRAINIVVAQPVENTDKPTLHRFVGQHAVSGAYTGMPLEHEAVNDGVGEYVRDQAHINGMESFWSMLKRG